MSFSDYLENELLDHTFGKGTYTPPTIWVALSTADPGDGGTSISEPVGGNYARYQSDSNDWDSAASGSLDNALSIVFNTASADWGTITHFALFDASSGGNMLAHAALTASKAVNSGETPKFAAGALDVELD